MLLAAELPPPAPCGPTASAVVGHQDEQDGRTAVTLGEAIDRHGADALRYFLLREVGFDNDGDFTWERFDAALHLGARRHDRQPRVARAHDDRELPRRYGTERPTQLTTHRWKAAARGALAAYARAMDANRLQEGAAQLVALASAANRYVRRDGALQTREAGGEKLPSSTRCSRLGPPPSPGSPCWHNRSSPAWPRPCGPRLGSPPPGPLGASGCVIWIP